MKNQKILAIIAGAIIVFGAILMGFFFMGHREPPPKPPDVNTEKKDPIKKPAPIPEATYDNTKTVDFDYGKGTLKMGLGEEKDDYIYLNIQSTNAKDGGEIGYYVESTRGEVELSPAEQLSIDQEPYSKYSNFIILRRTYEEAMPSIYRSAKNFGARWRDDPMIDGKRKGTNIRIRGVNLKDGTLEFILDAKIAYDEKAKVYALDKIVHLKPTANEADAAKAVDEAIKFAVDTLHLELSEEEIANAKKGAILDTHNVTYFPKFLNKDGEIANKRDFMTCKDTLAVNLPLSPNRYGFLTVYFAPRTQITGMESPTGKDKSTMNLRILGYDPPFPMNRYAGGIPVDLL